MAQERLHDFEMRFFSPSAFSLDVTDPEFADIFREFAFETVIEETDIPLEDNVLASLAASIAGNGIDTFRVILKGALRARIRPECIKELIYHVGIYVGIARLLPFITVCNEEFDRFDISFPLARMGRVSKEDRLKDGRQLQNDLFEDRTKRFGDSFGKKYKFLERWISAHCYGDIWTRDGLSITQRQMITIAALTAIGGSDNLLKEHIRAAFNKGMDKKYLVSITASLIPYVGFPRAIGTLKIIEELDS